MPTLLRALCLLSALLVVATGCDSGGDAVGITGEWEGVIFDPTDDAAPRYPIELTLRDTGQRVTGRGRVDLDDGPFLFAVITGSFVSSIADLELEFDSAPFMGRISAQLTQTDPAELTGTISARGAANGDLVIELVAR